MIRPGIALLAAGALAAQTAPQTGSLAGTVTNSVTGEPILRAHVTVHCNGDQQPYGALTNEKGEFQVGKLPATGCWATAARVGFTASAIGRQYSLANGERQEGVKLTLAPAGVITGRVLNSTGDPVQGVEVSAELPGGNSRNTASDEKGRFRIGGLHAGKYRVKATPQGLPLPPEIRTDGSTEVHESATYYPDSLAAKTAQRVEVKAGAEVDVEIHLVRTPIVTVSGKVTGLTPGFKDVEVTTSSQGESGSVKPDGTFALWRLDPGKYELVAQSSNATSRLMSAPLEIEVGTANIDHLELRMIPAFDVAVQLRFDDEEAGKPPQAPGAPPKVRRQAELLDDRQAGVGHPVDIAADDSFTLAKVQPGRYRLQFSGFSGFVKSIRAGETETEGDGVDVRNGSPGPLTVTLSSNFCEISGTVSDSKGPAAHATVVLARPEQHSFAHLVQTDSAGVYKFRVPPGKYRIVALDEGAMNPAGDVAFEDYDDIAETVDVSPGDKIGKDLKRH